VSIATRTQLVLRLPGFAGLLGCAFALGVGHSFVSPFLSLWGTQEIGMRPLEFGAFMTATSLSAITVATLLARWSDTHVSRKVMLMAGAAAGAVGYASYAFVRDPWMLVGIGMSVLAISAVCFSQLFALTREQYHETEIPGVPVGFLTSVVRVCFSLAWTAGPSIGAWMMVTFGFRGVFLGAASLYVVLLLAVVRFVPSQARTAQIRAAVHEPVWQVLTRGDIGAVFVAFLLIFAAHTINMLNLPLVLTQLLGGSGWEVGVTFGIGPLVEIPLMLWFGLLAARGHHLALIRFGAAATVLYFGLLLLARAPWQVFPIQVLHGVSFAIISNVGILFFQNLLPGQPGLATTIFSNAANVGNLVGFFGFGVLLAPVGYRGLFAVSALLTAVTLAIMLWYRPRRVAETSS
jgi:SET family sugar efflux transporter-like MFS transporter